MRTYFYFLILVLTILGFAVTVPCRAEEKPPQKSPLKLLLPAPQEMKAGNGKMALGSSIRINAAEKWAATVDRSLWLLDEALAARKAGPVTVVKEPSAATIRVTQSTAADLPENGYELKIGGGAIELASRDSAGVFNGLATLSQLIESCDGATIDVPECQIRDWPELATRAVHIDMTCQQYTAAYVQRLMRTLARYKINAILMEYSGMFPFRSHPAISRPDAFSEEEIKAIRRTAEQCNQEIIPFLQCAAHLEYVLTQDPTGIRLSEGHGGFSLPKGQGGFSYCLSNPEVLPFAESLIDEIVAGHPGLKRLHVGGDEVPPQTCKQCAEAGDFTSRYLKHYARIAEICRKRGIEPLMWTDMFAPFALQDKPEKAEELAAKIRAAVKVLPREMIGVDWWYGGGGFQVSPLLRAAGIQAFTASAARCDSCELLDWPRLAYHMENIRAGCLQAVKSTMLGTIVTSWSYRGCPHELCLPEYACAAYGWNTREADVAALLARFFQQRYVLPEAESAALAKAALAETKIKVPTIEAEMNTWNSKERTWIIPAKQQAAQLINRMKEQGAERLRASLQTELLEFAGNDALWQSALQSAKRHQAELLSWDLSRRHLKHRLDLSQALMAGNTGKDGQRMYGSLIEAGNKLREEWKELYRDTFTPRHMKVELDLRFDTEPGIIEAFRKNEK
jgi:hypothetical protein